jgi:hypothetical protein
MNEGDMATKAKITNDNISYEATYKPKEHNTPELSASGKVSVNYTPSSGAWNAAAAAKFGAPETGPARIWSTVSIFSYLLSFVADIIIIGILSLQECLLNPNHAPRFLIKQFINI